jgi:hypothetical protein
MINFGTGKLICTPTNLADGSAIAVPTPVILGALQDISLDIEVDTKLLHGSRRYPIAAAQGKGKCSIKAKNAELDGGIVGSLFLGKTATTGIKSVVYDSALTIPPTAGPYTITIAPPSSGTFVADGGVYFSATGVQLTRVASAPATGEYSLVVATGVYTFAAADQAKAVLISYEYSVATGGKIYTLDSNLMGPMPSFSVLLKNEYDSKALVCKLNRVTSAKLPLAFKSDDFSINDFEADAFADSSNSLGYICFY